MRFQWTAVLVLAALSGCAWLSGPQRYSVFFQPYSAELGDQASTTVHAAADFAKAHPALPIVVKGFSAPPDPKLDVDGLSDQRAENVKRMLIADGITPNRIATTGAGITDPENLPTVSVRRVDISVGR